MELPRLVQASPLATTEDVTKVRSLSSPSSGSRVILSAHKEESLSYFYVRRRVVKSQSILGCDASVPRKLRGGVACPPLYTALPLLEHGD